MGGAGEEGPSETLETPPDQSRYTVWVGQRGGGWGRERKGEGRERAEEGGGKEGWGGGGGGGGFGFSFGFFLFFRVLSFLLVVLSFLSGFFFSFGSFLFFRVFFFSFGFLRVLSFGVSFFLSGFRSSFRGFVLSFGFFFQVLSSGFFLPGSFFRVLSFGFFLPGSFFRVLLGSFGFFRVLSLSFFRVLSLFLSGSLSLFLAGSICLSLSLAFFLMRVSEEWKMETRSSPLCNAFMRAHPLICGKMKWARQRTSHKGSTQHWRQSRLLEGETLFAYLDDVYHLSTRPRCRCACHLGGRTVQSRAYPVESWENPSLKSRWRSSSGSCGAHCSSQTGQGGRHCLEGRSRGASGAARGESSWHSDWTARVRARIFGQEIQGTSDTFERIPLVEDLQSSWLLLLMCGATRANFWLRTVRPDLAESFAVHARVWQYVQHLFRVVDTLPASQTIAFLPFREDCAWPVQCGREPPLIRPVGLTASGWCWVWNVIKHPVCEQSGRVSKL